MRTSSLHFFRVLTAGTLVLVLLTAAPVAAQSQNLYDWAGVSRLGATLPGGGTPTFPPSFTWPEQLAADVAGNVLIAGVYDPDVIFDGPGPHYQAAPTPSGFRTSSYVAKYTPAGAWAWSLDLTSNSYTYVHDLAVDGAGNAYVLGSYYQQLRIGGTVVALANAGNGSLAHFLAKIGPTGALAWVTTVEPDVSTASRFRMQRLAVDGAGNSVVQGEFERQVTINGTTFTGPGTNTLHALVLRYDALGAPAGAFAAYTSGSDQGRTFTGIALAPNGECYLGGSVASAATIQFGTLPALTGPAPQGSLSYSIGFVVKLNAAMAASWALTTSGAGGTGQGFSDLAVGPQGRCFAVGALGGGAMTLGPQSLNTNNPNGAAGRDLFLARIAPNGTVESLVGGGRSGKVWGLAIGPLGEATIGTAGGLAWGNVQLPGAAWPASTLTGLVQLDAAGVPQRGWQAGIGFYAPAVAVDGLNRPVLAGTYNGPGPFTFGTQQRTSPYAWNTLIARTAATVLASRAATEVAGLEVYPNPARAVVEVRTAQGGPATTQLLDALGRRVRIQALSAGQTRVDLAGVAPGAYTLRVQQGAARSYRRLVVAP